MRVEVDACPTTVAEMSSALRFSKTASIIDSVSLLLAAREPAGIGELIVDRPGADVDPATLVRNAMCLICCSVPNNACGAERWSLLS